MLGDDRELEIGAFEGIVNSFGIGIGDERVAGPADERSDRIGFGIENGGPDGRFVAGGKKTGGKPFAVPVRLGDRLNELIARVAPQLVFLGAELFFALAGRQQIHVFHKRAIVGFLARP